MTLSAVGCIHRGLLNLRANWELVLFHWLQALLVTVLMLAGLVPLLAVLGWSDWKALERSALDWPAVLNGAGALVARGREAWLLLAAALVVAGAIWLMAMLVYCYLQGGILGVLMAGERQAPSGRPRHWQWFRTFSAHDLRGWAGRYLWRYFWLFNLFLVISSVWLLLPLGLILFAIWGGEIWGPTAALGIGCGGAVPLAFSLFVLAFWLQLAQADLARAESAVWAAVGTSLRILGRRLPTLLLLLLVGLAVGVSVAVMFAMLTTGADLVLRAWAPVRVGGQLTLSLLQWLISSLVAVAFAAALVGLVRDETSGEIPS